MIYDAQQEAQGPKDSVLQGKKENHRYQRDVMVSSPDEHLSRGGQKATEKPYRTNVVVGHANDTEYKQRKVDESPLETARICV